MVRFRRWLGCGVVGLVMAVAVSCSRNGGSQSESTVQITGSDTMVNLANEWAQAYGERHPDVAIQVSGGGSGVGINNLSEGMINIANASRLMKPDEIERAKKNTGKTPKAFTVGRDAIAIYVHKENPIESISLEELSEIYSEGGKDTQWSDLGVQNAGCKDGKIVLVSRQNNSGTYEYFREAVLGKGKEFRLGSIDQSGSSDVVALVSKTPCAIGYSGMGYRTPDVKLVKISKKKGEPGVAPTVENVENGTYPISRPLYMYTLGEPTGAAKAYLDWILSTEGQKIVLDAGYVPIKSAEKDVK
ncbi:MAG: phosphate ABC transporter substrate-binding protein [Pirellulales bacterium]